MPSSFAVLGPGKVGRVLARRWRAAGYRFLGFCGGSPESAAAAVRFAGGEVLATHEPLARATFVLVSVPDAAIASATAAAAAGGAVRPCSLWLHASGATPLEALAAAAAAGARTGSLHPLAPFADPSDADATLDGCAGVLDGDPRSLRLLAVLARAAGLRPVVLGPCNRVLYHAACALAVNGATVLHALAAHWYAAAAPHASLAPGDLAGAAMRAALAACDRRGAVAALTGPAARGDAPALERHLAALAAHGLPGARTFAAVMADAARSAAQRGDLSAQALARVLDALEGEAHG